MYQQFWSVQYKEKASDTYVLCTYVHTNTNTHTHTHEHTHTHTHTHHIRTFPVLSHHVAQQWHMQQEISYTKDKSLYIVTVVAVCMSLT